jgi:hypothetical protein
MDSGKPTSGMVQRHMSKCGSCREYAELCTSLKPKFAQDKQAILEEFDESLNEKIMAVIPEKPERLFEPKTTVGVPKRPFRRPALVPSLAAAISVLAISVSLFFFVLPRDQQAPSLGQISSLVSIASPENVLLNVESPLEKEYAELKRAFEATGKYLISSFEFRLGQQAK